MLTAKKDSAQKFQEHLSDLQDALKANRIQPIRDLMHEREFPKELAEFLRAIVRLPVDHEHVQGWTALYSQGRQVYEQAQTTCFLRKSEG